MSFELLVNENTQWVGCRMLDEGQSTVLEENKEEVREVGRDSCMFCNFDGTWVVAGIIP